MSGAKVIIGKGGMKSADYRDYFVPAGAVYLTTVGYGTGALLGRGIKRVRDVYWLDELGVAQAIWVFEVERFGPLLVDSDLQGNSLFEEQSRLVNENIKRIYTGLRLPALRRFGETDDRQEDLTGTRLPSLCLKHQSLMTDPKPAFSSEALAGHPQTRVLRRERSPVSRATFASRILPGRRDEPTSVQPPERRTENTRRTLAGKRPGPGAP